MTRYRYRLMYSDSRIAPIVEEHDVDLDYADDRVRDLMARRWSISQRWWVERQPLGAWERFGSEFDDSGNERTTQ